MGVQVHDAKLVASMTVYSVTHLLTFNVDDFKRYSGITAITSQGRVRHAYEALGKSERFCKEGYKAIA